MLNKLIIEENRRKKRNKCSNKYCYSKTLAFVEQLCGSAKNWTKNVKFAELSVRTSAC